MSRLYVGGVGRDVQRADLEDYFASIGRVVEVRVLSGFAFVEYRDPRDAEDAISELNGRDFMGDRLSIDFARAPRERRPFRDDYGPPPPRGRGGPPPKGIRLTVTNLADGTTWQNLKDFARSAGPVIYTNIDRMNPTEGVVEFPEEEDVDEAFKVLDGARLNGNEVKLLDNMRDTYGDFSSRGSRRAPPPREDDLPPRRSRYDEDAGYDRRRSPPPPPRAAAADEDRSYRSSRRYEEDDPYDRRPPPPRRSSRSRSPPRRRDDY